MREAFTTHINFNRQTPPKLALHYHYTFKAHILCSNTRTQLVYIYIHIVKKLVYYTKKKRSINSTVYGTIYNFLFFLYKEKKFIYISKLLAAP